MDVVWSGGHALGWCVYVGGSVCMELVLRHAQGYMRPSQVAVVCERAGQLYRWWSFAALTVLGVTGVALAMRSSDPPGDAYTNALIVAAVLWLAQMAIWMLLAFRVHPAMHTRLDPSMSEEQMGRERRRVGAAIRSMDRFLRAELALALVAVGVGASLHLWRV